MADRYGHVVSEGEVWVDGERKMISTTTKPEEEPDADEDEEEEQESPGQSAGLCHDDGCSWRSKL